MAKQGESKLFVVITDVSDVALHQNARAIRSQRLEDFWMIGFSERLVTHNQFIVFEKLTKFNPAGTGLSNESLTFSFLLFKEYLQSD